MKNIIFYQQRKVLIIPSGIEDFDMCPGKEFGQAIIDPLCVFHTMWSAVGDKVREQKVEGV